MAHAEDALATGPGPRSLRYWPLAVAGLLVAASLWELGADYYQQRAVPSRADWRAAGKAVRAKHKPGDLIVTAPGWADPLGRLVLGDLVSLDDVSRPDAATYARIFELSIRGARHADTWGAEVVWRQQFGGVRATLYRRQTVVVAYDFYARLAEAELHERVGRKHKRCNWDKARRRFRCGPSWKDVRQIRAEIGFAARRCVLALPADGTARVLTYKKPRLGQRLVIYTGLRGYDPRYRARRAVWKWQRYQAGRWRQKRKPAKVTSVPIDLAVAVDGVPQVRLSHPIEDEGWRRHVLDTSELPVGASVSFTITTRYAWKKHFCFYARAEGQR